MIYQLYKKQFAILLERVLQFKCNERYNIMTTSTRQILLTKSKQLFAVSGYEGFSIRILAKESGIGISSIYHFFKDKDDILEEVYKNTNRNLGLERQKLPKSKTAEDMLLDIIKFQFNHIEDVIFVLKYYIHFRPNFIKLKAGYFPEKGYLHIEEVLIKGLKSSEFNIKNEDIDKEAKVITHAINGFLLEYYPDTPSRGELKDVCLAIHLFIMRSLTNKEVVMK